MDPITLAAVTTAVVTLALDAAKEVATDAARHTWAKVKGWLGLTKEPATEDLATAVATALAANLLCVSLFSPLTTSMKPFREDFYA